MKKYTVKARRKYTDKSWSEWSSWDDYAEAEASAEYCRKIGYEARIIDNGLDKTADEKKERTKLLTEKQIEWAYEMWKQGYRQDRICEALGVCKNTLTRAFKGRPKIRFGKKPRIRTKLIYEESNNEQRETDA